MINLNQSIAKVKGQILGGDFTCDDYIEAIMHEGAGEDRKTLLAWLNEQVEARNLNDQSAPTRAEPVYRPEKRGNLWMLYDVNNGEMRQETFEVKGDASAFITRLENGEVLDEPYFHKGSE